MMIAIYGLAPKTKYADVKGLIRQVCHLDDFILDNLIADKDGTKKVRVGLPDENEGYKLIKCLDGYRLPGNFILKVVPFVKGGGPNVPVQSGFDSRPGSQPQQRNDYPNQSRNDFMNQARPDDFNRGPQGSSGMRGPSGPPGPGGPPNANRPYQQGSMDNMRPSPWSSNNNPSAQWGPNSTMSPQLPQNNFNYGAPNQNVPPSFTQQHPNHNQNHQPDGRPYNQSRDGPPSGQNYGGYPPKSNIPPHQMDSRQNLRNIQTVDSVQQSPAPMHGGRQPPNQQYQQDKPMSIMKDNFHGPTQYNLAHPGGHQQPYSQQGNPPSWQQRGPQGPQPKPQFSEERPIAYEKPFQDRNYPMDQARDPKNLGRPDNKEYEKRRSFSPPGRRDDVMRRKMSPSRKEAPVNRDLPARMGDIGKRRPSPAGRMDDASQRRISPGRMGDTVHRRSSPQGRRDGPHGRRYSPPEKRMSPDDRRNIPAKRRESPPRRLSPSRRLVSPGRREERQSRFSPSRHHADKIDDKYGHDSKDLKKVRPAYEPTSHAQNQANYSGGYRPKSHDNVQYSASGRQEQSVPWQRHRDEPIMKKQEDRQDTRTSLARAHLIDKVEKHFSPTRKSRSPNRRDRSPIRDRYRRNSRSPRSSHSPRRSWALEKRRSPDAPPPPLWPGQRDRSRTKSIEKDEKPVHKPVWEGRSFQEEELRNRHSDERRQYDDAKIRIAKDLERDPPILSSEHHYTREPKFSPRDTYDERRDNYRRRDSPERMPPRDDLPRRGREESRPDDYNRREESSYYKDKDFDKDFDEVYNRAFQFKKKAEQMRKSNSRKNEEFEGSHRHTDKVREDTRLRYEDIRYRDEESQRIREIEEKRDDRPRDDRVLRDDRAQRDNKPRDDRSRDDKPGSERMHHHDDDRSRYQPRDNLEERHKPFDGSKAKQLVFSNDSIRLKRNKAVDEIAEKMLERSEEYKHVQGLQRNRILEELKISVARIFYNMFGDSDVSFIEMIIKYQARYNLKDEAKILQDVINSFPKTLTNLKRHATEPSSQPTKISRDSPNADVKLEPATRPKLGDSNFNVSLAPPSVINVPCVGLPQSQPMVNQTMIPMMVSAPFYQTFDSLQQNLQSNVYDPKPVPPVADMEQPGSDYVDFSANAEGHLMFSEEGVEDGYRLYLCKDDFERITNMEADLLKDFIITQMFKATTEFQGWAPDFTLKGLQTSHRYEVITKNEGTKNWFQNLDFSDFDYFHVLVYTKEELWYERAAIWLPGHSRVRNIEPLDKLKLQNKKLEGVNIHTWKFVKKIVTHKGTRLYVDMPPSSARALEANDMKLSYELQQVNVFLKAVAVDKDSFDAGLKELCLTSSAEIIEAIQNAPMPSLTNDPSLVKLVLKGSKTLDIVQARKIKEMVIYQLFKYHQQDGLNRTDFVKYGFLQPNYFAILPMNRESKRWLMGCSFGKVNRQAVLVIGGDEDNARFIKMSVIIPDESKLRAANVIERLKQSNRGVKGINFNMWRSLKLKPLERNRARFEVQVDMESVETLATMRYQLDYKYPKGISALYFNSEYSQSGLEDLIKKYKAEMTDSYDVANMDLESDQSDAEIEDVVCLD